MKKIISIAVVISILALSLISCGYDPRIEYQGFEATHIATIVVKNYGTIKVELYGTEAPITVENFVKLANEGFYDGLTFHRIMEGFMAQGGGFNEDGSYKQTNNIKGEFLANGVYNRISHQRGVISMARAESYNSGSSQFFIMHETNTNLNYLYAAFGCVVDGMNVVDAICEKAQPYDGNGGIYTSERPVIETITIEEIK